MRIKRLREIKLSYQWPIEEYLQRFCNADRLINGTCPPHLNTPAFLISHPRDAEYAPPTKKQVCHTARKQSFKPLFRNSNEASANSTGFSGISSYLAERKSKDLNWHPPAHVSENMTEEELDLFVESKISEFEAVLEGKVDAGVYAADINGSCFKKGLPQCSWSLNGMKSRFSVFCKKNPKMKLARMSGLKNLTYVSEPNTVSPLHIEDADLWSINYHWRGAPKLWIFFDSEFLLTYVNSVRKDLAGKILLPRFLYETLVLPLFLIIHFFMHSLLFQNSVSI